MKSKSGILGHVRAYLDGKLIVDQKNLITNVGLAQIAGLLNGLQSTAAEYIALGTGASPADVADIALESEVTFGGGSRTQATVSQITTAVADDTAKMMATFNITTAFSLRELGLFDQPTNGVLFSRITFATVSVSDGQTLVVTWTYQVTEV